MQQLAIPSWQIKSNTDPVNSMTSIAEKWDAADISQREQWLDAAGVLVGWRCVRFKWDELPPAIKAMLERSSKSSGPSHRFYIVVHHAVPEGFATNDYGEALRLLEKAREIDLKAYIVDNEEFYPKEFWIWRGQEQEKEKEWHPEDTFEDDVEKDWNARDREIRYRILDSALPKEYKKRDLERWVSLDWFALPIFVKEAVKQRYRKYWGLEEPKVEVGEELRLYYQATLEPSKIKEWKFPAPPPRKISIREEEKPKKFEVERRVEPGLARFGVYKPEQPPLDYVLKKIEFEKKKRELEGG